MPVMHRSLCIAFAVAAIAGGFARTDASRTISRYIAGRGGAAPCASEELSCGLQKPVASDGIHRFTNSETDLSAVFPRGSRVCETRSGDAPRGFYAWYGKPAKGCPERRDIDAARMSIDSSWNALFYTSLSQVARDCVPLSPSLKRQLRGRGLSIPGVRSLVCGQEAKNGAVAIKVYVLAGARDAAPVDHLSTIYAATLETRQERARRDLPMFRVFLQQLRLGVRGRNGAARRM
jgi:hypothetical protein